MSTNQISQTSGASSNDSNIYNLTLFINNTICCLKNSYLSIDAIFRNFPINIIIYLKGFFEYSSRLFIQLFLVYCRIANRRQACMAESRVDSQKISGWCWQFRALIGLPKDLYMHLKYFRCVYVHQRKNVYFWDNRFIIMYLLFQTIDFFLNPWVQWIWVTLLIRGT